MIVAYAVAAVAGLTASAVVGCTVLVSVGIHREEAVGSMTTSTSDRVARVVRVFTGLSARSSGAPQPACPHQQDLLLAGQEME